MVRERPSTGPPSASASWLPTASSRDAAPVRLPWTGTATCELREESRRHRSRRGSGRYRWPQHDPVRPAPRQSGARQNQAAATPDGKNHSGVGPLQKQNVPGENRRGPNCTVNLADLSAGEIETHHFRCEHGCVGERGRFLVALACSVGSQPDVRSGGDSRRIFSGSPSELPLPRRGRGAGVRASAVRASTPARCARRALTRASISPRPSLPGGRHWGNFIIFGTVLDPFVP